MNYIDGILCINFDPTMIEFFNDTSWIVSVNNKIKQI